MTEGEALAWLYQFINYEDPTQRRRGPGFTLAGMRCLLDQLGHPERAYASVVVAGSKGKGSTSAMIASILTAAGHRTGLYSQPHLHHWRERARVDGHLMSPAGLVSAVERLQGVVAELPTRCPEMGQPTYYELGTAAALLHFASVPVEAAVLEIGLGGRLDAVNTVTPLVSAITPISLEHTDVLGTTIAAIAWEKAGIIKPGVPVVVAPQLPAAAAVFERVAGEHAAPLIWAATRAAVELVGDPAGPLALRGAQRVRVTLPPGLAATAPAGQGEIDLPLLGAHQRRNAATALATVEALAAAGLAVDGVDALAGLAGVRWPGRLEVLQAAPLVVVDGAHNPESAARLRAALAEHFPGLLTLVLAVAGDKDIEGIARELAPGTDEIIATAFGQPRAAPIERIHAAILAASGRATTAPDMATALRRWLTDATETAMICVTGSLMSVAEARTFFGRGEV